MMLKDEKKWKASQVHAEYPEGVGGLAQLADMLWTAMLGHPAPNISIVVEDATGSVGDDGSPTGCYASIQNNESDITANLVEYPILDFDKVDPVQVVYEGPLAIMSTYKTDEKSSLIYADFLCNSLQSFNLTIWSIILVSFFTFPCLLFIRKLIHSANNQGYSPIFETFSHLIGQQSTDFADRTGRLISFNMTIGFFLIMAFYLNLMSTDLVVVTKPEVINTYRDIMKRNNMTVAFAAVTYDAIEFEAAKEGTIQEEFWNMFRNTHVKVDLGKDVNEVTDIAIKALDQKAVFILSSLFTNVCVKQSCKMKVMMQKDCLDFARTFSWVSSDPEGTIHSTGLIMRQGMKSDRIRKGKRRLKGLYEGGISHKAIEQSLDGMDFSSVSDESASFYDILKCMSKSVNYNEVEVEKVTVMNFKYPLLVCIFIFMTSFSVLFFENVHNMINRTRVTPI